jgi:hypothetical protein
MRTTVNLEPEALSRAKLLSRQRGIPLGKIISELILKATQTRGSEEQRNGVPVFPRRAGASPDLGLVHSLRD